MHRGSKILLNSPPQGRPLLFKGHFHHTPSLLSGQISCTEVVKYYWILHLKRGHFSLKAIFTKDHLYYQERPFLFKGHIHQRPSLLSGQKSCTEVVKYYWILHLKRGHSSLKAIFTTDLSIIKRGHSSLKVIFTTDHLYYQARNHAPR